MTHDFDAAAATWDDHPDRVARAETAAAQAVAAIDLTPSDTVLDYGCGTGLLAFALRPHVARVAAVDISPGMLARVRDKAARRADADEPEAGTEGTAITAHELDLARAPWPGPSVDALVSLMALHHVEDLGGLLDNVVAALQPGGRICVFDLADRPGGFHDHPVPHDGFAPEALAERLRRAGFDRVAVAEAFVIEKGEGPTRRSHPVLRWSGWR